MIKYLSLYLVVGGMPAVVKTYLLTNDLQKVYEVQRSIIKEYMRDVTQYDARLKMHLRNIYSLIPSELKKPNKRFYLKNILDENRFKNTESDFVWLKEAGIAIPVFNVDIPQMPLELAKKANIFKLFLNDVGLLCSLYMDGIQLKILTGELDFNGGAVWENFVAQELLAHGFETLYYYNSKKFGEVDFLINFQNNLTVLEIKSGKDFKSHTALNKVINSSSFDIPQAFVLSKSNDVEFGNKITYICESRIKTCKELTLELLYDFTSPYGFRDWDWGEFKLHPDLDLEERINQIEILKDHKEELRKRREKFFQNN
jgi:predicted AAA+ superfamily ATPase